MKKIFTVVILLMATLTYAQKVEINGVRKNEFRGVKSIENRGYYTFYVNEKLGKGMVEFMLEIYDLDLNLTKKTPIQITKHSTLIGGEFNGKDFLFAFADIRKKQNTFITLDINGSIIKQEVVSHRKFATAGTTALYPDMSGDGFYITATVKEKKWGYSIQKVDRNMSTLWEKTVSNDRGIVGIEATESGNGKLMVLTVERPSLMSKKVTGKLVEFNSATGDIGYEYSLYDGEITGIPSAFLIDKDGSVITAGMYFEGEKWDNVNSDGIFFLKLSPTGERMFYNKIDWENGIQEALKATHRKFSIGSKPKVLFHEILKTESGFQIVSETFRKTVKAGTVLAAMAGGGNTNNVPLGFTVMDFIIFNYDNNGVPIDINKIEKPYKSIYVDGSIGNAGGVRLAYYFKQLGLFSYEFTTQLPGSKENMIVYSNWEEPKGIGKGAPYVGMTTIKIGEDSKTNKIPLEKKVANYASSSGPDNDKTGAIRSKPGYICIYFYNKKEQTINLMLEEIKLDNL